jgi:hypothetical protein
METRHVHPSVILAASAAPRTFELNAEWHVEELAVCARSSSEAGVWVRDAPLLLLGGSGRYDDISFAVPTILLTACSDHPIAPDVRLCKCRSV